MSSTHSRAASPATLAARARRPCLAADRTAQHCIAGLLLGVACCPDGKCGLCREVVLRGRQDGLAPDAAIRALARARRGLVRRCPACGFPPPPPLPVVPQLPRLDRTDRAEANAWTCRVCGEALSRGRRQFCSDRCYAAAEHERARS